jgi:hypothetical protein
VPTYVSVLQNVFGVSTRSEHSICDSKQTRALSIEQLNFFICRRDSHVPILNYRRAEVGIVTGVVPGHLAELRDRNIAVPAIADLKSGAACVRETQAANFTEGLTVGYAEMIGKRQLFFGW